MNNLHWINDGALWVKMSHKEWHTLIVTDRSFRKSFLSSIQNHLAFCYILTFILFSLLLLMLCQNSFINNFHFINRKYFCSDTSLFLCLYKMEDRNRFFFRIMPCLYSGLIILVPFCNSTQAHFIQRKKTALEMFLFCCPFWLLNAIVEQQLNVAPVTDLHHGHCHVSTQSGSAVSRTKRSTKIR